MSGLRFRFLTLLVSFLLAAILLKWNIDGGIEYDTSGNERSGFTYLGCPYPIRYTHVVAFPANDFDLPIERRQINIVEEVDGATINYRGAVANVLLNTLVVLFIASLLEGIMRLITRLRS